MCGIVGFQTTSPEKFLELSLDPAVAALRHRGPDGFGTHLNVAAGLGLGHTRLSILELSDLGSQPMRSEDESVVLVYNGEIYNYRSIRESLIEQGHQFDS